MKRKYCCAVYFLLILGASVTRATLLNLLHFIETKNGGKYFSEDNERNFTRYDNNPYGISRNFKDNYQTSSSFLVPNSSSDHSQIFAQDSSTSFALHETFSDNNQHNNLWYQHISPKLNPLEEFVHKLKKNADYYRPFVRKKPITAKYFAHKSTTTGLDVNLPFANGFIDTFKDRIKTVYPGTLWCGGGDLAKGTNDLGLFALTDNCCKMHDLCPLYIRSRNELNGLKNSGLFTRSHCDCDREFYYCLKRINTFVSNKIGYTYFNILGPQCFREEYPILTCAKRHRNRCYSYLVDDEDVKTWQWFDNKFY